MQEGRVAKGSGHYQLLARSLPAQEGVLRALSTEGGHIIWEYNTVRDFETVNGLPARGGSMGAPGPTVAGSMLFVGSGYIGVKNGLPGNVLLAFSAE